ncbi:MAG: hypothetical protein NUV47_02425 [Patescibacteria group bacterium]|nr:hypothetical protein [Patescibacteria group bacterium]
MNIIVQFKQNDFVLFITIDKKGIIWVESRTEMEFYQYLVALADKTTLSEIVGNEKKKILEVLEKDTNMRLCMERKYPVETPQMSKNLRYYNVFKIQ